MAWASKGTLGVANARVAAGSIALTTVTTAVAVGDVIVVMVAVDNTNTGNLTSYNEVTGVTDSAGNTYFKGREQTYGQGAAQGGVTNAIFYGTATSALAVGGTITAAFASSTNSVCRCISAWAFTKGAGNTVSLEAATSTFGTPNPPPALDLTTSSGEFLRIRSAGFETNSSTAWTPTTSWTVFTPTVTTGGGGGTTHMALRGEFYIVTATTASSNPSGPTAVDYASCYIALKEAAAGKTLDATTPGSYALTGTDATTRRNLPLVPDSGSYVLTGTDATLNKGKTLVLDPGSYSLTGTDTPTTHQWKLDATVGSSYALAGVDANLRRNLPLVADSGSYSLLGTDASLRRNLPLVAEPGSYALTGTDASGLLGRKLDATVPDSYSLVGADVTLTKTSVSAAYSLAVDAGSYALTGIDGLVLHGWRVAAGDEVTLGDLLLETSDRLLLETGDGFLIEESAIVGGSYTILGSDVTLSQAANKQIAADSGVYGLTGNDAALSIVANKQIAADAGSYSLIGTDAALLYGWRLDATVPDFYSLVGTDVTLILLPVGAKLIVADPGSYLLTGSDVTLTIQPAAPAIIVPTRGEWPEKERRKRRYISRTARDRLRDALERLYDGGDYDPPVAVLEQAETAASAVVSQLQHLPDLAPEIAAIEQLIERVRDMLRLRQREETYPSDDVEVAQALAREHLAEAVEATQIAYNQARFSYYARITLLLAEA